MFARPSNWTPAVPLSLLPSSPLHPPYISLNPCSRSTLCALPFIAPPLPHKPFTTRIDLLPNHYRCTTFYPLQPIPPRHRNTRSDPDPHKFRSSPSACSDTVFPRPRTDAPKLAFHDPRSTNHRSIPMPATRAEARAGSKLEEGRGTDGRPHCTAGEGSPRQRKRGGLYARASYRIFRGRGGAR